MRSLLLLAVLSCAAATVLHAQLISPAPPSPPSSSPDVPTPSVQPVAPVGAASTGSAGDASSAWRSTGAEEQKCSLAALKLRRLNCEDRYGRSYDSVSDLLATGHGDDDRSDSGALSTCKVELSPRFDPERNFFTFDSVELARRGEDLSLLLAFNNDYSVKVTGGLEEDNRRNDDDDRGHGNAMAAAAAANASDVTAAGDHGRDDERRDFSRLLTVDSFVVWSHELRVENITVRTSAFTDSNDRHGNGIGEGGPGRDNGPGGDFGGPGGPGGDHGDDDRGENGLGEECVSIKIVVRGPDCRTRRIRLQSEACEDRGEDRDDDEDEDHHGDHYSADASSAPAA